MVSAHLREAWGRRLVAGEDLWQQALSRIPSSDRALIDGVRYEERSTSVSFAEYEPDTRTIVGDPSLGPMSIPVLVHEIGHAIDHALDWLSLSKAFKTVAKQYVNLGELGRNLPSIYRGEYLYREIWADGYCALYGGQAPMWWPGNDSDLALVIREARSPRDLSVTGMVAHKDIHTLGTTVPSRRPPGWTMCFDCIRETELHGEGTPFFDTCQRCDKERMCQRVMGWDPK